MAGEAAAPVISSDFDHQVRPIIDLIDNLRQLGLEHDIALPSIVVVGDQSSGKSSVLEALSGVQLPRGTGIVTRCPLELRLKSSSSEWRGRIRYRPQGRDFDNDEDDFGVDEDIDDPGDVEARVRTAQNLLAGPGHGISTSRISLEISSPDVPDLTLIDLPGITRVAIHGQQANASELIRNLIKEYVKKEETIILAVVPANVDIATTEALQLAKEVDREGKRTLGVVTKPDLVDRGAEEELIDIITNSRYYLRRGYTLVKCRGQAAISGGMTLRDAIDDERRYFREHPHLRSVPEGLLGMRNLSIKLTNVLVEHIKSSLPGLKAEVREKLEKVNRELAAIGEGLPNDPAGMMLVLTKSLQLFTETLGKVSEGDTRLRDGNAHELNPFSQTRKVFAEFAEEVCQKIPKDGNRLFLEKIKEKIQATRGRELPRFVSYQASEELIKEIIQGFKGPARLSLTEVDKLIFEILTKVAKKTVGQYPDLEIAVKDKIYEEQVKAREFCEKEIEKIFRQELLVYTQDRTFSATYDSILELKNEQQGQLQGYPRKPQTPSSVRALTLFSETHYGDDHLSDEAQHTYEMIISYMNVCGKRLCDTVPMTILLCMVRELCDTIRTNIWTLLSLDPSRLLSEEPETAIMRQSLHRKSERLQQAQQRLRGF